MSAFNEYMEYCNDEDNAGCVDINSKIESLVDNLDDWREEVTSSMHNTIRSVNPSKRQRADYQYRGNRDEI